MKRAPKIKRTRGRRSAAEELGIIKQLEANPLPVLGSTPIQMLSFIGEVTRRVGAGQLDRPTAEVLLKAARAGLQAERTEHDRHEVEVLRQAVADMRRENDRAEERQRAQQQGRVLTTKEQDA